MNTNMKHKVSIVCIALVIILSALYMFTMWAGGYNWLGWLLAIVNIVAGPACLIAYLREVKKGIFRDDSQDGEGDESINTETESVTGVNKK